MSSKNMRLGELITIDDFSYNLSSHYALLESLILSRH